MTRLALPFVDGREVLHKIGWDIGMGVVHSWIRIRHILRILLSRNDEYSLLL